MTRSRFQRVAVIAGGKSRERPISLMTGKGVCDALKRRGVQASLVDADDKLASKLIKLKPEAVYNGLHGPWGEDGTVQGLLEWLGLPYTGSGVLASAVCMDKLTTKALLASLGAPLAPHVVDDGKIGYAQIAKKLGPAFVLKPSAEGSSFGVVIIKGPKDFKGVAAVRAQFERLFFEQFLDGAQITCSVIDSAGKATPLPILELRPKNPFYDFEAKYTKGMTDFLIPAPIGKKATQTATDLSIRVHEQLGLRTSSRTDMVILKGGKPVVLEVNTHPGMTPTSDLPAQAEAVGIGYDELVVRLMNTAGLPK